MNWENGDAPEGWTLRLLGEVTKVVGGGTPKTAIMENFSDSEGHPWITPADLSGFEDKFVRKGRRYLTDRGLATSSAKLLPAGTVLFSSRAPIGYVAIAENPVATNQGFRSFLPSDELHPEYLYYALKYLRPLAEQMASGTTFSEISGSSVAQLPIAYPDRRTQAAIVEVLDISFSKRRSALIHLEATRHAAERFRQSVLAAASSGHLTADWREHHLKETEVYRAWRMASGAESFSFVTSGSRGWARHYSERGSLFLRVGNLDHFSLDLDLTSVQHVRPPQNAESKRTKVEKGDLVISITAELGMVAVIPADIGDAYVNQHVAIARPIPDFNSRFLAIFLAAPNGGQKQFEALQRGATKAGLGLDDLRSLAIPVPSRPEQDEIVSRVDKVLASTDGLRDRIDKAARIVDSTSQSILAKAFRGESFPISTRDQS